MTDTNEVKPISEFITIIIGTISFFVLIDAIGDITTQQIDTISTSGLISLIYHGFLVFLGIPWMYRSIQRGIFAWHRIFMIAISIYHSLAMLIVPLLIISNAGGISDDNVLGIIGLLLIALMELLPILLLRRSKINNTN
ncbi:MAG: hypothetical protein INQ03_03670 [Candidatus Heimdallarchaeota archaeon]|nr:hypothetical protein [Candidatus Heimdallarchaeota archaeon]